MKFKILLIFLILIIVSQRDNLFSQTTQEGGSVNYSGLVYNSITNRGGFIIGYSPLEYGFLVKMYGVPRDTQFKLRLNYLVIYVDSDGQPKGEFFTHKPLVNWEETANYSQKVMMSVGFTNALTSDKSLLLGIYTGMGFSSDYEQYFSTTTEKYWYRESDNKFLGEVGLDLIYRYKKLVLNVGTSVQSLLNVGVGIGF